jgi:hypothetical protein
MIKSLAKFGVTKKDHCPLCKENRKREGVFIFHKGKEDSYAVEMCSTCALTVSLFIDAMFADFKQLPKTVGAGFKPAHT